MRAHLWQLLDKRQKNPGSRHLPKEKNKQTDLNNALTAVANVFEVLIGDARKLSIIIAHRHFCAHKYLPPSQKWPEATKTELGKCGKLVRLPLLPFLGDKSKLLFG